MAPDMVCVYLLKHFLKNDKIPGSGSNAPGARDMLEQNHLNKTKILLIKICLLLADKCSVFFQHCRKVYAVQMQKNPVFFAHISKNI